MPFQTAGSLVMYFPGHETYSNYTRELDLEKAVATARYTVDGVTYTREVFSSFADDVIIMQLTASKKVALNLTVEYNNPAEHKVFKESNRLVLEGKGATHEGIEGKIVYQTHTTVKNKDGKVALTDNSLTVSDASSVVLYISIGTNFVDYKTVDNNQSSRAAGKLAQAIQKDFRKAQQTHTTLYDKQFGRFALDLGKAVDSKRSITER